MARGLVRHHRHQVAGVVAASSKQLHVVVVTQLTVASAMRTGHS